MEYYNNRLCATTADLDGIITEANLKNLYRRDQVVRMRRACNERPALYDVESLPHKFKVEVYRKFPNARTQAESSSYLLDQVVIDGAALNFFEEYTLADGRHLSYSKQEEYSNNAAILNQLKEVMDDCISKRAKQGKRLNKTEFWNKATDAVIRVTEQWPNSLPTNPIRLKEKFSAYQKDGYGVLVNGRFGNKNSAKVDDDTKENLIITLLANGRNLQDSQVCNIYNMVAEKMSWDTITPDNISKIRKKNPVVTAFGKQGSSKFRLNNTMQVKRSKPTFALSHWSTDGWDAELLYKKVEERAGGYVTTYNSRLTVVVVLDTCIDYPIGYAIGDHETPELIQEALRNAVDHTLELFGQRYRVNQFQSDHYAMKKMTPLYEAIASKVTPARVKNAKAKPVERYFRYLNNTYCRFMINTSGYGVTTSPSRQPSSEFLNKNKQSFPDQAGCVAQLSEIMERERAAKHDAYMELFKAVPEEYLRKLTMTDEQYLLNFGKETNRKNALETTGLRPTIEGVRRVYDCFDPKFREYPHVKWTVKYDPHHLQKILAVNEDGSLRFMLEEKYVQPMALADRKDGDSEALARVNRFNNSLGIAQIERLGIASESTSALIEDNKELLIDTTLAKLLITDSNGQHKDRRNDNKPGPAITPKITIPTRRRRKKVECKVEPEDVELEDLY